MTNEEKAREIRNKNVCCVYSDCPNVYHAAMKMAEWKDNRFREIVSDYIKLAYDSGQEANMLEDLLNEL